MTIIPCALILAHDSHAQIAESECPNVNLSSAFGPAREQGTVGMCYAMVAADLIGYQQRLGPAKRVSAIDVATTYLTADPVKVLNRPRLSHSFLINSEDGKFALQASQDITYQKQLTSGLTVYDRFNSGGYLDATLRAYDTKKGLCLESQLPSETTLVRNDRTTFLENVFADFREDGQTGDGRVDQLNEFSEFWNPNCQTSVISDFSPLAEISQQIQDQRMHAFVDHVEKKCSPRAPMDDLEIHALDIIRGAKSPASNLIAKLMDLQIPVGISYNADFLTNGETDPEAPSNHVSSIVGTRWNSKLKRCEFLLRNSWGPDCDDVFIGHSENCDKGNIWISETDINEQVGGISFLSPK